MVSRNNRIERMEQAAERQSHFGIRKLTIGAASVLLGTTLWLGTNANVTHAESNDASSNGDASQAQESNNAAAPSIGKNTQVTVVTNKSDIDKTDVTTNQSNSETSSDLQSKVDEKSQDDANKAASVKANINATNDAAKVTESDNNSGKTVSSSNLNNNRSASASSQSSEVSKQAAVSNAKAEANANTSATSSVAKTETDQNEAAKTVAAAQNANAVQQAASDQVKSQISNAAQAGKISTNDTSAKSDKLDLGKLDVSSGELGAQLATDTSLNNISNKLMNAALTGKSASNQVNANADLTNNSALNNVKGASLISGADSGENSGNAASQTPKKIIVEATNTGNLTDNKTTSVDQNLGIQGRTEAFDLSKYVLMPNVAPKADANALSKLFGSSLIEEDSHKATANSWDDLQTAINNSAINDITISGNITATGDLNIDRALTIEGADKNAALTLGTNAINNNSDLTLKDITINGSILGKGTVNVEGTVTSNVDSSNQKKLSTSQLNNQIGTAWYGADTNNWKAANIESSKVNVDLGATLNINRTINGDGIDLGQTGAVNVGINGNLNITLKDGTENYKSLRSTEKNGDLENANTAIRALSSGTFTTEDGSTINLNVGHGRGIVFNEPFGGNTAIQVADQTAFYRARYDAGLDNQGGASIVTLGPNTTLNLSGRDGFILGNHAKFTTGDFSKITFHNGGNGVGLQMDAQAVAEISPHSTMIMLSDGKNHSGVFNALNYIGLGENAQFTVDHDAAFIYKLSNAWANGSLDYADNFNIVSVKSDSNPTVNIKDNAIFDGESDYRNIFGELLSFSYNGAPVKSTVNIDGARYVNFLRHGATTPGAWQNVVANDPQGKHSGNLFYSWPANTWNVNGNTYNVYKWTDETDSEDTFDGTTYDKLVQSIKDLNNSSSEYWKNVKNLTLGVNMHRSNLTDQTPNTQTGVKNGWQSDDKNGHGFDTEFSQRLALVATKIPTEEVLQNNQSESYHTQIVYDQNLKPGEVELYQKGIKGLTRTTKIAYYTVDLSDPNNPTRILDTTKGNKGYKTTTTVLVQGQDEIIHIGPQTATINYLEKDGNNAATPIKDANGNNIVGTATGAPIASNTDGSIKFDDQGNTTPEKIKYNDGKILSSDSADLQKAEQAAGSDYKYDINRDDWSQAVNLGTNVYDNQGLTRSAIIAAAEKLQEGQTVQLGATQGPTYNVVLFKSEHVAQKVEQVSITQKIQRAISYKNNKDRQNISDPNGADRNTAAGLDDMSKSLLHGEAKDEQSITLKGIAYLDTSTGKFVKIKTKDGHAVDADGNYIALDDNGNAVIGDLQSDGTVKARLTNGKTTLTNYVVDGTGQGTFKWSLDTSDAAGFTSPTADHYTVNPGSVPALDGSIKTTATFVKDAQGNTISNPTLQQVMDYLNNESAQDALQQAVSQDVISDATNYPQMSQVPSTQYIFDQFRLSNTSGNTDWNYVVTLATDRDDPTGAVHIYVTSPDYSRTYMSRTAEVNNADDPVWYQNSIFNRQTGRYDQFTIRVNNWGGQNGDSVSVNVNDGFTLKRIFGYGAQSTDASASWGDYKPRRVTQTINYIDEKTGKPIQGYPSISVSGLIGQHFDANGVNHLNIPGYTFDQAHSDTPSGTISDYQVGQTYSRTWYNEYGTRITEHHTLTNADGTMHTIVYVGNQRYEGTIAPNGYMSAGGFQIQNPWVKPTTTVNLRYTENPVIIDQNQTPYYVVYTPNAKGTVNVIFHDTTTNTDIIGYGPKTALTGDEGTDVTGYTPDADITTLEGKGYLLDTTSPIPTGDLSKMPAKYTDGNQTVYINLKHGLEDVDKNNSHDFDVDRTVTRQINYTINGQPTTQLTGHTQTAEFERTGHWDKVDHKLVDVVDGKIVTEDGQTVDGHLSDWKVASSSNSNFTGFAKPDLTGYHVDSVTADPTAALDANAVASGDNEGQVKEVTATADYGKVTVTIDLTKDAAEKANLKIVDDTTGKTLNDGISAEGDENTPISFTTGESTVQGYLDNHYRFVSVVNDADPNNPLSTKSYADGAAKFGNYDTDPQKDQNFTVHLVHVIDTIDEHNPHGQKVTATVTRQVNYTVDGAPDSSLPSHTETVTFNATGYYDEVTKKVVDLADGTTADEGKVKLDQNGNETDGHLTWTYSLNKGAAQNGNSTTFTGYAAPAKDGYHVNSVTVNPASDKDANADNTGLVKDLTVNMNSHDVTITINLIKNSEEAAHLKIVDDTTGKTLNSDINATGDENTAINFTNGQATVDGYLQNGYKFVSVVNDGTQAILADGSKNQTYANANFGNYDTDPKTDQNFTVHLVHKIDTIDSHNPHGQTVTATVTRQVNYTVDGVADSNLPSHTEQVVFNATGYYDEVTKKVVDLADHTTIDQGKVKLDQNGNVADGTLKWTYSLNKGAAQNGDSTTFTGYAVPTKKGYHVNSVTVDPAADKNANADDTGLVKELSVNTKSHDVTITINLTKNAPAANVADIVNYIDDTTGQTLRSDNGNVINTLAGKPNGQVTYTTADIIKVYESQGYKLVSNDFKDGHEVFGNNGHTYNVHLAHKVVDINKNTPYGNPVTATVTRQVNYTVDGLADSTLPSHTETANFSATGHYDLVEHKVVDMVNGQEKVTNGKVDDGHLTWTVDGGTEDSSTLTGYAVPTKAGYHVNGVTVDPAADKDANADDSGLVKDLSVNHTSHNVTVTINLTKNGQTTKGQRTINTSATVHYVVDGDDADKPAAPADNVQNDFQFNYSGDTYDAVTGKLISKGQWTNGTSHAYNAVTSPTIKGYHTVTTIVPSSSLTVTTDKPTVEVTVRYVKNSQTVKNQQTINTSATVHYVVDGDDADKPAAPADNVQNGFEFKYGGDIYDSFTGQLIHAGSWNADSHAYKAVNTPALNGYHAEVSIVPASQLTVNRDNPNITITVHYVKNGQTTKNERDINTKATVHYVIDGDDANKPAAPADNVQDNFQFHYSGDIYDAVTGKFISNGYWNATTHAYDAVTSPVITGYHAQVTVVPASQLTVTQDKPTVEVTVHYVKNGTTVRNQQTVTASQKVEYQDDQGNTLSPEKDQNFTFNYSGDTYDAVTGDLISRGNWSVASHNFTNESVPVISGYVAVSGYTKNGDNYTAGGFDTIPTASETERNRTFIVVYKKTSNIVPVDPNHNPIPHVPNPQYPNDPKNPTNVTPNEPVPTIPGYTPEVPTVTPTDPTKPTEVVYTKDQVAQVVYRDVNDPKNIITLDTDSNLTGKAGEAVKDDQVPTKISNFEEKGYVLVSNNFTNAVFDDVADNVQTFYINFKHQTTTVTPDKPGHPGQPVNPDNPNGPKYPNGTDINQVKRTGTQTIHYQGAGDKTPADNKQSFDFTRTITFDDVTGKIITTTPWNVSSHTFGDVDTPVVDGYHADRRTAGGTTITPDDLTKRVVVTYSPNGKIIPVDPNGNPIPNVPTPQYPTSPNNPTTVTPDEPVPKINGMTPQTPTVTPKDPGKDTKVIYTTPDQGSVKVIFHDDTSNTTIPNVGFNKSGNVDTPVNYTPQGDIKSLEDKGYKLVPDQNINVPSIISKGNQVITIHMVHDTETINPNNPGKPGTPINPNDPNGPKWGDDTDKDHLQVHGSQTVHYQGAGDKTPADKVQNIDFNHEIVIDKVTGKQIADHGWKVVDPKTGNVISKGDSHKFGTETTQVVNGYVADKKTAGGLTATVQNPNVKDTVTYTAIGKIVPVDPNGNPIPGASQPKYQNDPTDPTKVLPNEPVPTVPGWTPTKNSVTPTDPIHDTPVVYNKTPKPDVPVTPAGPTTNPAPTPSQPQPTTPQPTSVTPHAEPTPTPAPSTPSNNATPAPAPHPEPAPQPNGTVTPKGEVTPHEVPTPQVHTVTPHPEQTTTVMPNGQVVNRQGQVTGYVDQTGTVHNTLPQTGEKSNDNVATILAGGAAVAISLIGLAGVRKRRD